MSLEGHEIKCQTENTLCDQRELANETKETHEATNAEQPGTPQPPSHDGSDQIARLHIHNSNRKHTTASRIPGSVTLETASPSPVIERKPSTSDEYVENGTPDKGFPVLSLTPLEQWDLDLVLQTLKKEGLSIQSSMSGDVVKTDSNSKRSQENIMERLEAFCKSQSCGDIEVKRKTVLIKNYAMPQVKPFPHPTAFSQKVRQRKSSEKTAAELQLSLQESPTVYIDLRCPEVTWKGTRACKAILSNSEKPTRPLHWKETHLEKVHNNRPAGSAIGRGERTGKSMLLQKLREANGQKIELDRTCLSLVDKAGGSLGSCTDNLPRRKFPLSKSLPGELKRQLSAIKGDQNRSQIDISHTSQQRATTKQPACQNDKQRSEQLKQNLQRKQHHQLQKKIECHQPRRSVNEREPASEKTDVLFDSETSYLQSINTLPTDSMNKECLLLTVCLSSLGIVSSNSHRKAQTVELATTKSHIYNSLVSWFLALVGPGPRCEDKAGIEVPFWVAGLQQLWRDDGLALHVLAVSHEESSLLCSKSRKRGMNKDRGVFHHRVCRFLSQTSLTVAAYWVPQLRTLLGSQPNASDIHVPSSCLDGFISVNSDKAAMERTFGVSPGFYWQTLENQDPSCLRPETMSTQQSHTEVAVALGYKTLIQQPLVIHHTLQLLLTSGLDVCGIRLLYPSAALLANWAGCVPYGQEDSGTHQPVLVLALRGPHARAVWQDVTGPADPLLARKTDPVSINSVHCSSKDKPLFYSPHLASRVQSELCLWFAGRAPTEKPSNPDHALTPSDRVGHSDIERTTPWYLTKSPTTLCAIVKADVFLAVSPVVAPCCYSLVLSVCEHKGFSLKGLRRVQLSTKRAQALGLSSQQVPVFCSPPAVFLDQDHVELSSHCLVLLLRRENALRHCASLPAALMKGLEEQGMMGCMRSRLSDDKDVEPGCCFHVLPYSESFLRCFGGSMWEVPEPCCVFLSSRSFPSNPEVEQVVVLTLSGTDMSQGLGILHRVLSGDPGGSAEQDGFELLALKWLPTLSQQQAREVSPFEVGDTLWQSSLVSLAAAPALVCALRRVDAHATLRRLFPNDHPGSLNVLISSTPELAYRQALLFFFEGEIIPDNSVRQLLKFLPPPCINTPGSKSVSLFNSMIKGPQLLVTLCLFKPGVWNHALGRILRRVQQNGFTMVGLCVVVLDTNTAMSLLPANKDPCDVDAQVNYLCSGPSLALCLQRENAVKNLLDLLGPEDQIQARAQDQFLWRACYGRDHPHSGIYGSASYQRAVEDVKRMFPEGLCCTETDTMRQEQIPCLHSDPMACEIREQSHTLASMTKEKASLPLLMASGQNGGSLVRSALCQTTCLLMPSNVLRLGQVPLHLDLLEQLLKAGCHLVAGRMSILDEAQRQHIARTLVLQSNRNGMMSHLPEGPCLMVVLQRDNVVTCFESMLERIYREKSDLEKVGKSIMYPSTEKEAVLLLCYLFDDLSPDSHQSIVPQLSEGSQLL